jgi:hypothetical protein
MGYCTDLAPIRRSQLAYDLALMNTLRRSLRYFSRTPLPKMIGRGDFLTMTLKLD